MKTALDQRLARAQAHVTARTPGYGLDRACYQNPDIYRLEMHAIWRTGWLFVGHSCELAKPGDFFTVDIDGDPIVVVRQDSGQAQALHNVCRHRGSIVVLSERGHHARLSCPYHRWVYGLDGALLRCPGAPEGVVKDQFGLKPIATAEVAGLVFVSLGVNPPPVDEAQRVLADWAGVQGMAAASIAMQIDYEVNANWKLIWENNRECFHCESNHPQYVKANFDHVDLTVASRQDDFAAALARSQRGLEKSGIRTELYEGSGLTDFPDPTARQWWSVNRTALEEGFVTESIDGKRVAPLMGGYATDDVGTLRVRTMPNFWCHASCDHVVTTRLIPRGLNKTSIRVSWLVDADASEGRDYDLSRLLPFWQLTSEQDWTICERQQRGIMSSAFTPGPLSPSREPNVDRFLSWYVTSISNA